MSHANPTALRLGMTGTLSDRRFRVVGRVVMGMEEDGETYYWHEFNLADDRGGFATLVYEDTDHGGEWRMFTQFEMEYPVTAADAASKRVGDPLNLDGTPVRVTLVDESRVYEIEGEAPEGVEVGDVAHYFNAEAANTMQVVSWTGDEVECFRGVTLPAGVLESAFKLPRTSASNLSRALESGTAAGAGYDKWSAFAIKLVGVILVTVMVFVGFSYWKKSRARRSSILTAPASPLAVGNAGTLDGVQYRIRSHALVEVAQVGRVQSRREYELVDDEGNSARLIHGYQPGAGDWMLFLPLRSLEPMTPAQAAALSVGTIVKVDGVVAPVAELFQAVVRQIEFAANAAPTPTDGPVTFGYRGRSGMTHLEARWNNDGIHFERGRDLKAAAVLTAFGRKP